MIRLIFAALLALPCVIPSGKTFVRQLQQRDSILIADQLEYGFVLDSLEPGTMVAFPDMKPVFNDTLSLVKQWHTDTLSRRKGITISAHLTIAPFEEGRYQLPPLFVLARVGNGAVDTLVFEGQEIDVKTVAVDTATFQIHDLKPQMTYPLTVGEVLPWAGGVLLAAALVLLVVWLLKRRSAPGEEAAQKDPPHIVALRELDRYRSEKYWAPERQKAFYSGITDTLRVYMDARFGVDAPEMTTSELFSALKGEKDLTPQMYSELKELFERADFVKFAKFIAPDEDNAKALPLAVSFVTSTYQAEIEDSGEGGKDVL